MVFTGPHIVIILTLIGAAAGCYFALNACFKVFKEKTLSDKDRGLCYVFASTPTSVLIFGILSMILISQALEAGSISNLAAGILGLSLGTINLICSFIMGIFSAQWIREGKYEPPNMAMALIKIAGVEMIAFAAFILSIFYM